MTNTHNTTIQHNPLITPAVKSRFMSYVSIDKDTDAWLWAGGVTGSGYGAFWLDGKNISAHRLSYEIAYGIIGEGLFVCHKYERLGKINVNPVHLFLGTALDNMQDASNKGRLPVGINNKANKLEEWQVIDIATSQMSNDVLSLKHGVSNPLISKIRRGELWSHITGISPVETHSLSNKSGYRGVSWAGKQGSWYACIGRKVNGKNKVKNLGYYSDKVDAAKAYDAAAQVFHGDNARLNF